MEHLALAEAFLGGDVEVRGDWLEVMKVTEIATPDPSWIERARAAARLALESRRKLNRATIAFHYDRPVEFFLPWFERWRSYSHGFYETEDDEPGAAQARKLQYAIDALRLKPGMRVFDMGCGWGSFLEYAGMRGIEVHAITISKMQHEFVSDLIERERLPCTVELVDFLDYSPSTTFDGAVFMGTFEHFPDYDRACRFLARKLRPAARFYADFCSHPRSRFVGSFLAKYIWPGAATYVDLPGLIRAAQRAGFFVTELVDDTRDYALTVRDWAEAFDRQSDELAKDFGRESTRAFQLFLHASHYFLATRRTYAYHLIAARAG
jgi:cyclopropane-fatty-acyl-phospholipid synthase